MIHSWAGSKAVRGVFALGVVAIVLVSVLPAEYVSASTMNDKVAHFLAYAIVGCVGAVGFLYSKRLLPILFALVIMGVGLEFCQAYIPGRAFDVGDMIANGLGALLVPVAVQLFFKKT